MIIPIRCFTCNKVIAHLWNDYLRLVEEHKDATDRTPEWYPYKSCLRRTEPQAVLLPTDAADTRRLDRQATQLQRPPCSLRLKLALSIMPDKDRAKSGAAAEKAREIAMTIIPDIDPHFFSFRSYFEEKILVTLVEGILFVTEKRPPNPIEALAYFLIANNPRNVSSNQVKAEVSQL